MNDKDHLVGQLTNSNVDGCKAFAKTEANIDPRSVCGEVADSTMLATFATNRLGLAEQRSSYVMIFLLKTGLCIKVIFMHNSCWFNYYDKCYVR